MKRVARLVGVKPEHIAEYKRYHAQIWPELAAHIASCNITNYSIFLRDDGLLIGYLETPDFAKAVAGMQSEEVNARWQKGMVQFFEELPGGRADTSIVPLAEVFHLS